MSSIHRLRDLLHRALDPSTSQYDAQSLFNELHLNKQRLFNLLDVGPRNNQEQREIESGKPTLNGKATAINGDFARQALFLSQQLDCSEKYVASLLHDLMNQNPNIDAVSSLESTIEEFHLRRRHLVDSINFLLEATRLNRVNRDSSDAYENIALFMTKELLPGEKRPTGETSLAQKLILQVEQLDDQITKAEVARKNAASNTVPPSAGNPSLGSDVLTARHDSLKYERRSLVIALCTLAQIGSIGANELKMLMDWLSTKANNPSIYYVLTAVFLALEPADPTTAVSGTRQRLAADTSLVAFMTKKFDPSTKWSELSLKATALLKWTLFLTEARHNDTTLENRPGFKAEELETQIWNAVQGDAFTYLALSVVHLQDKHGATPSASLLENIPVDQQDLREIPPIDFKDTVLFAFESLVRSLITHASSELRKIKQRQEDLVLAGVRTDRARPMSRFGPPLSAEPETPHQTPRHDIAMLYSFIGLLYSSLPPDSALQFWGSGPQGGYRVRYQEYLEESTGRLPSFLQWAVWSTPTQDLTTLASLYDMLTGLANGQQSSELAYNFMARGGGEVLAGSMLAGATSGPSISWTAIFSLLDSWAISAAAPRHQPINTLGASALSGPLQNLAQPQNGPQFVLSAKDVLLAKSFLRVLATVVQNSIAVRTAIAGHLNFRAIPTLLSLIPLSVPLELKGAIFDTLCSFCLAGAGAPGVEICKAVWIMMEKLEIINVRGAGYGMGMATGRGVEVELEQIEATHQQYPSTIPFLRLLSTLIHTPKQLRVSEEAIGSESLNTVPETLGQPYRLPGIGPFTSFVVDNVFGNMYNREYSRPSDRWLLNDLCLAFIERSLASFDIQSLVSSANPVQLEQETILPLLIHPGYDVMKRLLSDTQLQRVILAYVVEGLGGFEKGLGNEEPFFRNTIIRVLRIVHRVLEIQDIFLDVFIPLLSDLNASSIVGTIHSQSYFTRFDQALSFGPMYIPAIAAYMAYPNHAELVLLSIKIISMLSLSLSSSSLVTLIERNQDSERILGGFMQTMRSDSMEDVEQAEEFAESSTGAGAPSIDISAEQLEQGIRLAGLQLLIQDTELKRPYPNIGHYLLFGGKIRDQTIQDPRALGARPTAIHILLDIVNAGVPRSKTNRRDQQQLRVLPLFLTLPGLAERCYRVIYQLCVHPRTTDFTSRYLRSREDFFARQLARIPSQAPPSPNGPPIEVVYGDGSRILCTVGSLSAFLRLRSYIFDLVALELHVLTAKGHHKAITELLEILFGTDVEYEEEHGFPTFHEVGQSPMRIIDFLQSLMFDWADSHVVEPLQLQYLAELNLQGCFSQDSAGCEVVDRSAVLELLQAAYRSLHLHNIVATQPQKDRLSKEVAYILDSCAVENHRRKVSYARAASFGSWRRLLDMALTKCFDRLPHDRRENMLFDLLHVLPLAIQSSNIEPSTAVLLSETVLSTITKLREDRRHQLVLQSVAGDPDSGSLPAERLHNLLRHILEGILNSNQLELVRGNLYASLINFIHLTRASSQLKSASPQSDTNPFAMSLASSMVLESSTSFRRSSSLAPSSAGSDRTPISALEAGNLSLLKPVMERFISVVARDAIDGTEVWKTIAFMLLDSVVQLSSLEQSHVVLTALNRHGILVNFVHGVKDSDSRLLAVLKPDPDDFNALYVYESKMSLFIRMAQNRAGAEKLLEAQFIPILARCEFVDARPEVDQAFIDQDSFLPSAIQRYHQLFTPALQVVDAMIATLGNKHTTAMNQALEFLSNHGATIAILLKSEAEQASLATLEEIHLIITLCASLLPSIPKTELLSPNSNFGSIHLGILGLATRCLARGRPYPEVLPQNDADIRLTNQLAYGSNNRTKFDTAVTRRERQLRKGIIAYIGACSDFTEPEITLVLSPVTIMPRTDDHAAYIATTVPTIGDAIAALDEICKDLTSTLKQISDLGAELAKKDQISIESTQSVRVTIDSIRDLGIDRFKQILREFDPVLLRNLEIDQKRILLSQELDKVRQDRKADGKILLDSLEMLLLLLWRHLEYYATPQHMQNPPAKTTLANAMRLLATTQPEQFVAEVAQRITPSIHKLVALESDPELLSTEWQDSKSYLQAMHHRLCDSIGLYNDFTSGPE